MRRIVTLALLVFICASSRATIIHVNAAAAGLNNGTSWTNAFTRLDTALARTKTDTIWVANGTYRAAHILLDSVKLFGGFAGTETSLSQRALSGYQTILDGDIGTIGNKLDNKWVLRLSKSLLANGMDCVIDGFRFVNGYNTSAVGGAICVDQSTSNNAVLIIRNCLFTTNEGTRGGGAIGIMSKGMTSIMDCRFENNSAGGSDGGAISKGLGLNQSLNIAGSLYLSDCVFRNNSAILGGALYTRDTSITSINRCEFIGNSAGAGGAIYESRNANLQVYHSLIVGNRAVIGGAHFSDSATVFGRSSFIHCTVASNFSSGTFTPNYTLWQRGNNAALRNNIIWGNASGSTTTPVIGSPAPGSIYMNNVVQAGGSIPGTSGTFTFNPLFIAPGAAAAAPFPITSNYNYHLSHLSSAVDTATLLGLTHPYDRDLDSLARVQGRLPDLGVYEWKACPWLNAAISGPAAFCLPGSVVLSASANPAYSHTFQWNGGTHTGKTITVTTSGINKVVVLDSLGCRSAAAVMVNAVPAPSPSITYGPHNTLSVPAIYASYQWHLNGAAIPGATGATINPTTNGDYTVRVTTILANCPGISPVLLLRNLAVSHTPFSATVQLGPNPAKGKVSIVVAGAHSFSEVQISIHDLLGRQQFRQAYQYPGSHFSKHLDLALLPPGTYFVAIYGDGQQTLRTLVLL